MNLDPLVVAGPTASGKSTLALHLAGSLNGEIVTVDSMQVYRGLDVGTAKPSPAEQARVRHHLIDVVDLTSPFDAAQFVLAARQAIDEIQRRGRRPILCGGTGFYFTALREGLGQAPPADANLRAELSLLSLDALLAELKEKDPETFATIDQRNPRRVIRAVEVVRLTGGPHSALKANWGMEGVSESGWRWLGIRRSNSDLSERIERRVDQMFASKLVTETEGLLAAGLEQNRTAMQAIGYRQVVEYLRGQRSLPETIELVKIRTRQFAKRQRTWFKKYLPIEWIDAAPGEPVEALAGRFRVLPGESVGAEINRSPSSS